MNRAKFFIAILFGLFLTAACSGKEKVNITGPLAVQEAELGPVTEDLVKSLPRGLVGDTANARYSSRQLRGEDEDDGS